MGKEVKDFVVVLSSKSLLDELNDVYRLVSNVESKHLWMGYKDYDSDDVDFEYPCQTTLADKLHSDCRRHKSKCVRAT